MHDLAIYGVVSNPVKSVIPPACLGHSSTLFDPSGSGPREAQRSGAEMHRYRVLRTPWHFGVDSEFVQVNTKEWRNEQGVLARPVGRPQVNLDNALSPTTIDMWLLSYITFFLCAARRRKKPHLVVLAEPGACLRKPGAAIRGPTQAFLGDFHPLAHAEYPGLHSVACYRR